MTNRGEKRENASRPRRHRQFGESTVAIRIPQSQEPVTHHFLLPLYTSKLAAGFPSPADDHVKQWLSPNDYLIANDNSTSFVQIKGDSMIDAGIFEKAMSQLVIELFVQRALRYRGVHNEINGIQNVDGFD